MKFTSDSTFVAVDIQCPDWGNNINSITFKLYRWDTDYATTVAGIPIADSTVVNYLDNSFVKFSFNPQPPGEYYWELSDGIGTVGVWTYYNNKDSVTSYFNGQVVFGNYRSKIYYSGGTSSNLSNDDGTGGPAIQIASGAAIYDNSKLLQKNPNNPAYGPHNAFHWWGVPKAGYYHAKDPWVIRRNLQMLSDADVDFLYLGHL